MIGQAGFYFILLSQRESDCLVKIDGCGIFSFVFCFCFSLLHIVRLNIDKNCVPDLNCTEFHNGCVITLTRKQSLNLKKFF